MDWLEQQIPPPSWHDEGDILQDIEDEYYCPLTSVVRKCYLNHLEQTLLQNYNSCRTQTIQQSTLQDLILHWEQNALRACMVTTIYQKAMRQLINAIKADTQLHKLTPVLTASVKSQRQRLVDVSTQTESASLTPDLAVKHQNGFDSKHHLKRERTVTRESSDGPFLTPPSDYPLPTQTAKKVSRRQLLPQNVPCDSTCEENIYTKPPSLQTPYTFIVPHPSPPYVPQQIYHEQYTNNWPVNDEHTDYAIQPISVIANGCPDYSYSELQPLPVIPQHPFPEVLDHTTVPEANFSLPEQETKYSKQVPEGVPMGDLSMFGDGPTDPEFGLGPRDAADPDYNWDQIEEEMARLYGQAFTEDDGKALSDEPEPEIKPMVQPEKQDDVDLDLLGALHETQLQSRLEYITKHWSLERQAKLKRRFIELFGREDDEDQLSQITPKEAAKCKQRIAPWIVKHLMPLYKDKRISSRHLFKSLAKHISDLLIQRNLYPDECDVWMGVQEFFRGGTNIECEADFST